jgi:type II secretory pathway pseudopilin PulG
MKLCKLNNKGQTLIEVLIAVAVGTLIVASLLGLAARSNRNANFARASGQASKLAQQGLEIVRNIESLNDDGAIIDDPAGCAAPCDEWTDLYTVDLDLVNDKQEFVLLSPGGVCSTTNSSWCLDIDPDPEEITHDNFNFKRTVEISDTPWDEGLGGASYCHTTQPPDPNLFDETHAKQVTVKVTWDDPTGSHETSVATCINNL